MKKKTLIIMALVLSMVLTACGGGSGSGSGSSDTLTVAMSADAVSLDPTQTNDTYSSNVSFQIYEGLITHDKDNNIVPVLAESYEQVDDLTYRFKIREGVKFHNGEELTPADVVFSLKRCIDAPNIKHLFNVIDANSVKDIGDNTVEFKLKSPYTPILHNLCHPGAFIQNEKAVNDGGADYQMNPVGTGPYKFVSWAKADNVKLERNEDYWGEPGKVQNIVFRIIPEGTNRTIELESGGVDIAYDIIPNDIKKISENKDLAIVDDFSLGTQYIGINVSHAPLDNLKVRQAIRAGIDLDQIIQAVWMGVCETATGPMPSAINYGIPEEFPLEPRDVEKAKALLAEAGYPDGIDISMATSDKKERIDIATAMKEQLAECNIRMNIEVLEWSAYLKKLESGNSDLFQLGWTADAPDADGMLYPNFHSSQVGPGGNYTFVKDPSLDALLDKARLLPEGDERAKAYADIQKIIMDEQYWIPSYFEEKYVGMRADVKNFPMNPMGWYPLKDVTKGEAK